MSNTRGHALALEGVGHAFGSTIALEDVSLSIAAAELIALLGPSGCGKTTMLQIIAGFLRPTKGEVLFDGNRVERIPANRRRIGMVFQNYALFPHLSVFENVAYGLRARKTSSAIVKTRVAEMLDLVQMGGFASRLPGQLSGGQQQRVALARALAIEPGLVLLDEPFSALDKNLRLDMQIEIKSLLKGYGVTSIMVTHDQEEALSMADRIVVLNKGRIEQIDAPDALYDRPASLFVNSFIGHANFLRGSVTADDCVRLAAGPEIRLAKSTQHCRGSAVVLSVRPENISLVDSNKPGAIPITVRATMPLGSVNVVEGVTPTGEAVKINQARLSSIAHARVGSGAWVAINDMTAVGVFSAPAETFSVNGAKEF
ncbi:ABC transporter ATP-binding protein [Bradyrhizobium sp. LHD-71]|uniref:ABC transporter ATP-binding protein n=1 Tax=Bradyrhizobium sp. LHD-71 TaxID=3072141 RepID=UPI00280F5983|nr:ABC transporter ATP-binding protein [Bradyrhizobium sp. LHD-71]MDQ8728248.1 ABC transporter ATP-binding protein [Bradyrhizobium sp. LHD-71]